MWNIEDKHIFLVYLFQGLKIYSQKCDIENTTIRFKFLKVILNYFLFLVKKLHIIFLIIIHIFRVKI